ncbi:MAG: amidohydrolase family protein, partial [Dermatophilaceae bacterium]|nr:amidohydrolase family protein [Dermatophilaceae bacterium]
MAHDLLIRNARPVRIDRADPMSGDAVGEPMDLRIRDGLVVEMAPGLPEDGARILDAEGRWVVPGLWDHHVHMIQWARTLTWLDLAGTRGPGEVVTRVKSALAESTAQVLTGFGFRSAAWSVQPTVAELDA